MVDPTLIEAKDNIIIIIIQMIEAAIDVSIDDRYRDDRNIDHEMRALDDAREALAEGMSLLDGIGSQKPYGDQWEDANWVMSEGLRRAKKGRNFELKFNIYLEKALSILKKKAFVLAFDDVDTNFKHGHLILETLRKYLTSMRLIIILSGDLDLYGRLIRSHIYDIFGDRLLNNDAKIIENQKHSIQNAVLELEEQYLLKVVPPQNRVRMLPLGGLGKAREIVVQSRRSGKAADKSTLPGWVSRRVRTILGEKEGAEHPFVQIIWLEHIRLVIGYLRALDFAIDESAESSGDNATALRASRSAVLKVFETRLRMAGVPSDLLDMNSFDFSLRAVLEWLVKQQEPATLARFGTPTNRNDAIVLHCLSLTIAQGLENPGNDLKALIALFLPAMMLQGAELQGMGRGVFEYLEKQATALLPETVARLITVARMRYEVAIPRQPASSFGSVGVAGRYSLTLRSAVSRVYSYGSGKEKIEISFSNITDSSKARNSARWIEIIGDVKNTLQPEYGIVWFAVEDIITRKRCGDFSTVLELVFSRRISERGEMFQSISALSLLAVIAELLLRDRWIGLDGLSVQGIIPSFDSATTASLAQTANNSDAEGDQDEPEDVAETGERTSEADTPFSVFLDHMRAWHAFALGLAQREKLAPSALGTIAARIHDDLIDLDAAVREKWGTGEILHRQITNILNALVAETAASKGRKESPKTSDLPLTNALRRDPAKLHPLAIILLTCPLIWAFLRPEREDGEDRDALAPAVRTALNTWEKKIFSDGWQVKYQESWIESPNFDIEIGRAGSKKPRKIKIDGFYDLLNVVPRYADEK